ncbi:MAG TPA: ATP-binding protein [Solirubrobacteraceae bacterium]|jgi:signal transduction histidine kinase|nr:ATP-binding protein [Solirubrobacteraceae bacterium]
MEANARTSQPNRRRNERRAHGPGRAIDELHRVALTVADESVADRRALGDARRRAKARAGELLEGGAEGTAETRQAVLLFATAEVFDTLRSELAQSPTKAAHLVDRFEEITGIPRLALAHEVLRAPETLSLPPTDAVRSQLAMIAAFAPLRTVSLWMPDNPVQPGLVGHVGAGAASRGVKELARRVLLGETPAGEDDSRRLLLSAPVGNDRLPLAALVGVSRPGGRETAAVVFAQSLPVLQAVLERDARLTGSHALEQALEGTSERRLTRLGFDLHDGPIQDVAVLAQDVRDLRTRLEPLFESNESRVLATGRLKELGERLVTLDTALRRISNEVRSASVLRNRPFAEALHDIVRSFAVRAGIEPLIVVKGDFGVLSSSQEIALLNIVHEALTNIREHSGANAVEIAFSEGPPIEIQVIDNGKGFDLEATLMRAARGGRLGLVAMHERVRLLGGKCRIESKPGGGGTGVFVELDRWKPLDVPVQDKH